MPATANERAKARRFNGNSATREYYISGATDEDDARDALLTAAPATWEAGGRTLYLTADDCEVFEVGDDGPWFGVAQYGPQTAANVEDDTSFEFQTGGGTQHLMASYSTVGAYGAGAATTDNGGMIGVTKDGVEGVDVPVGQLVFTITKSKNISTMTAAYLDTLTDLVGKTNDAVFSGTTDDGFDFNYAIGEVIFFGAQGGNRGGKAVISYTFGASPNATGLTVGGITDIAKKGWEYLWVRYVDSVANNLLVKVPKAVYVERVSLPGDFSALACT